MKTTNKELFKKFTVSWEGNPYNNITLLGHLYIDNNLFLELEMVFPVLEGLKCADLLTPTCFSFKKTKWNTYIKKKVSKKIQEYFEKYFNNSPNFKLLYYKYKRKYKKYINQIKTIDIIIDKVWDWKNFKKVIKEYISKEENKKIIFREYKKWLKTAYERDCENKILVEQLEVWVTAFSFID